MAPTGGQAGGWEGERVLVTKPVSYFVPGAAGLGSMWAAHCALDAGVWGRKARGLGGGERGLGWGGEGGGGR